MLLRLANRTNLDIEQIIEYCDVPASKDVLQLNFQIKYHEIIYLGVLYENTWRPGVNVRDLPSISWNPRTHMRDFEIMSGGLYDDTIIARGQGVGVIIIPAFRTYIKLYHSNDRLKPINFGIYPSLEELRHHLHSDLNMGYDVMVYHSRDKYKSWCEKRDKRDKQETTILFSSFAKYASYTPSEGV